MTKNANYPAFRWHPETGEAKVFNSEGDVPEGWLHKHPEDPSLEKPEVAEDSGEKNADGLYTDGPTLAEFVAAGYDAANYPPEGYAAREEAPPVVKPKTVKGGKPARLGAASE
jgi:hypothetical protein